MLTLAEFRTLANVLGVPVTWSQAKVPNAVAIVPKAIVQTLTKAAETIINAYGVNGFSVQVAANDLPVAPEKFDTFIDAEGRKIVIDTVVAYEERGTGVITHFTCYAKGKP